ncbi:MAG TPA: pirin family protein [Cyclobacteriaceae bacterium]|nr:pirin family protein [Cyclobacteriaceae bacterium]
MKKQTSFSTQGRRADIGEYVINRILPNRYADAVGPFVFLDHLMPANHSPGEPIKKVNGSGAHPHRGIATLTYILNGEADHFDSRGNHSKVNSGGAQWMKAGNGIIHDEAINVDSQTNDLLTHAMQFWVNLPAKNKAELPEYLPVQAKEIPQQTLADDKGWIKVIVGEYEKLASKIPNYSEQFLYHIHLEAGKQFLITTKDKLEYAAFLPLHHATINDAEFKKGEFIEFDRKEGTIEFSNTSSDGIDIILFGGEKYAEPIVAQGPFVMNSELEIADAYRDFHAGKYGKIRYA